MVQDIGAGDTVVCIDNTSRSHWAEWYQDEQYSEDILELRGRYLVREVAERDGETGLDVGIPTPWGDRFWNADRFQKSLLRLATPAPVAHSEPAPQPPHQEGL